METMLSKRSALMTRTSYHSEQKDENEIWISSSNNRKAPDQSEILVKFFLPRNELRQQLGHSPLDASIFLLFKFFGKKIIVCIYLFIYSFP